MRAAVMLGFLHYGSNVDTQRHADNASHYYAACAGHRITSELSYQGEQKHRDPFGIAACFTHFSFGNRQWLHAGHQLLS